MICSTTRAEHASSYGPGVAETKIACGTCSMNSSKRSGRLSIASGRRKPWSTSVSLRERSPLYMPPICGTVTCDSSTMHEEVAREVVEQRERRLARRAAVEHARVVLDAVAVADLLHHLEVVLGALAQALRLEQLALLLEARDAALELLADRRGGALDRAAAWSRSASPGRS